MSISPLWVERYRPQTISDYVFTNQDVREQVDHWITQQNIPHLLFFGPAGTGKTTLAKILVQALNIDLTDVLFCNGSKEGRKIEWVDKLITFCQTMPFGPMKIVLIDEADYLNKDSVQPAMRNLMEDYSHSVRFILTCNYANRIIPPLKSRCHEVQIEKTDKEQFAIRTIQILEQENIVFDPEVLMSYIDATYPDLRKCLNLLQANSITGTLLSARGSSKESDFRLDAVNLFKSGQQRRARELICKQARPEDAEEIFRWAYDNLDLWSKTEQGQDEAIIIIRKGLVNHTSCADFEINLSATLTELIGIDN